MKTRSIIMPAHEVRATLDGRKTQFRRPVKPRYESDADIDGYNEETGDVLWSRPCEPTGTRRMKCPYGEPGDRLRVRETFWCENETCDHEYCGGCDLGSLLSLGEGCATIQYVASPEYESPPECEHQQTVNPHDGEPVPGDWWLAPPEDWCGQDDEHRHRGQWEFMPWTYFTKHSAAQMPPWAVRLTLEVVARRAEMLTYITDAEAVAEGMADWVHDPRFETPRDAFLAQWDEHYGKAYPSVSNPIVWAVEYKVVTV